MMKAFTPKSTVYLFDNGERQYRAVFVTVGDDIVVSFTPVVSLAAAEDLPGHGAAILVRTEGA